MAAILVLFCFPNCKLALLASLSNVKFKKLFNLELAIKQKNTKMVAILE